jgi:hypothetical protein
MPANPTAGILNSLPLEAVIANPLIAIMKANMAGCEFYADFIEKIAMAKDGTVRMTRFTSTSTVFDSDGNPTADKIERVIDVPFFALCPSEPFGPDKLTTDFEMEIKTSEVVKTTTESKASIKGKAGFAWWSVSVTGSISHKKEQTRSTDTRAKLSIHMEASRQPTTEGLRRVLGFIMDANTRPVPKANAPELAKDEG